MRTPFTGQTVKGVFFYVVSFECTDFLGALQSDVILFDIIRKRLWDVWEWEKKWKTVCRAHSRGLDKIKKYNKSAKNRKKWI